MIARRVVEALGADYGQWRALTRAMLKSDLRSTSSLQLASGERKGGNTLPWLTFFLYGVVGIWIALLVGQIPGLLLAATIALTLIATILAMAILMDFQSVVVSPDDYEILAPQPVSSSTYFVVKLTNVMLYTGLIGALLGGMATVAFLVHHGPAAALAWMLALSGTVLWTTLAIMVAYAALLRLVRPQRLRLTLSFLQMILVFAIFGVPTLMSDALAEQWIDQLGQLDRAADGAGSGPPLALFALPTAWFASLLSLAAGDFSPVGVAASLLGVGTIGALVRYAGGRLSLSYAERLGTLASASEPGRRRARRSALRWRGLTPELRVVATLVRGQFRYDTNFRLAILSIIPVTIFYIFFAMRDGPLPDPFVNLGFASGRVWFVHFAALAMPLAAMDGLFRSESHQAAWMFFAAPVERAKLAVNAGNCVTVFFIAPYALLLAAIFMWAFGNIWHSGVHALALGLMSHLVLQARILASPRLPFSEPPRKGSGMGGLMGMVLVGMAIAVILPLVFQVAYSATVPTLLFVLLLVLAAVSLPRIVERSIRSRVQDLEFVG